MAGRVRRCGVQATAEAVHGARLVAAFAVVALLGSTSIADGGSRLARADTLDQLPPPPAAGCLHDANPSDTLTTLVFASCSRHTEPQRLWGAIRRASPDLFVWLGDAVYADTRTVPLVWTPSPLALMQDKWNAARAVPGYVSLLNETANRVVGVWDDHDMGQNDGGRDYADREAAQDLFLSFLGVPAEDDDRTAALTGSGSGSGSRREQQVPVVSPRRQRDGVYSAYAFGPADRRVHVVLLDVRSHRDVVEGDGADLLGDEQWRWLERVLLPGDDGAATSGTGSEGRPTTRHSDSDAMFPAFKCPCTSKDCTSGGSDAVEVADRAPPLLTVIGSGTQVLPDDSPLDHWGRWPSERRRLLELVARAQRREGAGPVVLLSGDVHFGESLWSCLPPGCSDGGDGEGVTVNADSECSDTVVEVTASGMTHTCETVAGWAGLCHLVMDTFYPASEFSLQDAEAPPSDAKHANGKADRMLSFNFGAIEFDWGAEPPTAAVQVRGEDGGVVLQHTLALTPDAATRHGRLGQMQCPREGTAHSRARRIVVGVVMAAVVVAMVWWCCTLRRGAKRGTKPGATAAPLVDGVLASASASPTHTVVSGGDVDNGVVAGTNASVGVSGDRERGVRRRTSGNGGQGHGRQ